MNLCAVLLLDELLCACLFVYLIFSFPLVRIVLERMEEGELVCFSNLALALALALCWFWDLGCYD